MNFLIDIFNNMEQEWKLNFGVLIGGLGLVMAFFNFIYTCVSNRKKRVSDEFCTLSLIYMNAVYIITYDLDLDTLPLSSHPHTEIQGIANKKILDYKNELDTDYSYNGKQRTEIYPELKDVPKEEINRIMSFANLEFDKLLKNDNFRNTGVSSPVFFSEKKEIYDKIITIQEILIKKIKHLRKPDQELLLKVVKKDPRKIREKYVYQLALNPEYFILNQRRFEDPYEEWISSLLKRYNYLRLSKRGKIIELFRPLWWNHLRKLFVKSEKR